MEPALWQLFESGSADDEVGVIIRMSPGVEPPPSVRVVARFDDIFTARVRRGDIVAIRETPGVVSVKASTAVMPPFPLADAADDDDPVEASGATAETGSLLPSVREDGTGVIVGICDWGLDFTHPNFRNPDGSTRLVCLWDQRGFGHQLAPAPYNYGRLLSRDAINAALDTPDPCATLGYHPSSADPTDTGAHGTHVVDILAGNRREPGSQVGLASGAEIVFVHLAAPHLGELGNLGDSVGLLEGLDFCRRQAAGRPCVLHLSAGKTGGEKRGLSPLERAVDAMLRQPGIVLVQSVGNYASSAMHADARIGPDQHYVLNWIIPEHDPTTNSVEIWYSGEDVFDVTLISPNSPEFSVALGERMRVEDQDTTWGTFYHRLHEPNSGLNHIAIYLYPAAPSGMWRIALHGRDIVDGRIQAWIERDASRRYQSHFLAAQASPRYTTNTICNCFRAIAVGAYDSTQRERPATPFSSRGPTADGRQKPELVAPGYMIRAARSLPRDGWRGNESRLTVKSGTSMAAPWVSGTVALMMQAAGRPLNVYEIRRALVGSVDPHPGPAGLTSSKLGYGYLNTAAAVAAARRLGQTNQTPAPPAARAIAETESEDTAFPPIWVEDAEHHPAENAESCGCGGTDRPRSAETIRDTAAETVRDTADETSVWEDGDDVELLDEDGRASDLIETPFSWNDVREALDALSEQEGPR